jgi:ferritin-like metal-binding protein YciE
MIEKPARAKTCEATQGILAEMDEDLEDFGGTEAADDVLIGCAQALEHYEIARYGMLTAWAKRLEMTEVAQLLQQTVDEEKAADKKLSAIASRMSPLSKAA